jgi:apolipoprotein N-acyltransferase
MASALLLALAFGPTHWWPLIFVAPIPLLDELRRRRGWSAFRAGFCFGFVFFFFQFGWLVELVGRWVGAPSLALIPICVGAVAEGLVWFGALGWLISKCWRNDRPWLIPFVWAGFEMVRSLCPGLAYPWGLLATPLADTTPLIELAWFGSVFAVSAWALLPSVAIVHAVRGEAGRARMVGIVFGLLGLLSISRFLLCHPGDPSLLVEAGQPGVDLAFDKSDEAVQHHVLNIDDITQDAENRDARLLVLPEAAARDYHWPDLPDFRIDPDLPTLFGAHRDDGDNTYQSALLYHGHDRQHADKNRLVVFGEYVPGRNFLPFLDKFKLPSGDLKSSDDVKNLRDGNLTVAPLICFECLFPDLAYRKAIMGANIVAIMSEDNWFDHTPAMDQLRAGSIFRAVETGLPVVRSAETGYSMCIDEQGRVTAQAPLDQFVALPCKVPSNPGGPFPLLPGFALLSLLSLPAAFIPRRNSHLRELPKNGADAAKETVPIEESTGQ